MDADIDRVLFHHDQIVERVHRMAEEIAALYESRENGLTLVPVLSGAIIFLADLIRALPLKMKIAVVQVSAYPGSTTQAQDPRTVIELDGDIAGRDVLIVDDILDSGRTIKRVQAMLQSRRPASVRTAVLLRKPTKAPADARVDFVGFDVEDSFVVGYGLDFDDHYRNYPHIGVLRSEFMP